MPDEPQHPGENRLRAAAQSRQQQAPPRWRLHGADRRALQAEVARVHARPRVSAVLGFPWITQGWTRWAAGAAVLAISGTVTLVGLRMRTPAPESEVAGRPAEPRLQENREELVLQAGRADRLALRKEKADPPASPPVPALAFEAGVAMEKESLASSPVSRRQASPVVPARPPANTPAPALADVAAVAGDAETKTGTPAKPAAATPLQKGTLASSLPALKETDERAALKSELARPPVTPVEVNREAGELSLTFQNRMPSTGAPVLQTFRVENRAGWVRIIDADGSAYTGKQVPAPGEGAAAGAAAGAQAAATSGAVGAGAGGSAGSQVAPEFGFRVEGTHRTSNQRVLFEGQVSRVAPGRQQSLDRSSGARGQERRNAAAPEPQRQLEGRARIGGGPEIPVQAVPLPPP